MANEYDKLFKENIEALIPFLAKLVLGIEAKAWEELPDDIQLTVERKPDFLKKVYPLDNTEPYLLHIEFQTKVEKEIPYRMLEYYAMLLRKYKLPIIQVVVQLGSKRKFSNALTTNRLRFDFDLIFLQDYDYSQFIESTIPEEVILAILANFKNTPPLKVIQRIIDRFFDLQLSKRFEQKYANQLFILSRLRNLEDETFKLLETMPVHYNIETDYLYKKGIQKGIEKGIEEGIEKGIAQKEIEKNYQFVKSLLLNTDFTNEKIAQLTAVTLAFVEKVKAELKK